MIYLDYASTTPTCKRATEEMMRYFNEDFANAASISRAGKCVHAKVEECRERIAQSVGALPEEIFFTSGATESNNWVIKNALFLSNPELGESFCRSNFKKNRIITSKIEHSSVSQSCEFLKNFGAEIDYVEIDADGIIDPGHLNSLIDERTGLISIMYANNEIGTLQPIEEIARIAKERNILFHTDAVQAYGKEEIDVRSQEIDIMSLSSHKIYGPKGVGALYLKKGLKLPPLIHGGGQEKGLRSGTTNSPAVIGFAAAVSDYFEKRSFIIQREKSIIERIRSTLIESFAQIVINGSMDRRICNNLNLSIPGIDHNKLLLLLDLENIYVSAGSACSSADVKMSKVIEQLNLVNGRTEIDGALRISCSYLNTDQEIERFIETFKKILKKLTTKK